MRSLACVILGAIILQAQPSLQIDQVKKLAFMIGRWKGSGWIQMGPGKKSTFQQTEDVRSKLGGLLVEIEGHGINETGANVHDALAIVSYDDKQSAFHFRAYDGQGRFVDAPASFEDGAFVWGFDQGPGRIRYHIRLNAKGQWHETGEFSRDGKNWQPVFEMTLDRVAQ
jgi:hypothetical protein